MSSPAAGMAGQAIVCWEGITQIQQASSAAVKTRHCAAVHLQSTLAHGDATHLQDMHCCGIIAAIFGGSHIAGLECIERQPIIRSSCMKLVHAARQCMPRQKHSLDCMPTWSLCCLSSSGVA